MNNQPLPPSRTACVAGIVFAMPIEADALAALASETVEYTTAAGRIVEGLVAGRRVAWSVSGAGGAAAARATRLLIDGHRPGLILSAGFAGGLTPAVGRGSVVHPRRVLSRTAGPPIELPGAGQGAGGGDHAIVSVDAVVTTAAAKRDLAAATGASLVDMETYAVATAAVAAGLPCVSIRVISDDAAQDLPREIAALVQPQSGMRRLGAAIGAIGRRPRSALDMWQLWEHAVVDGRTLAAAIERFLESLIRDRRAAAQAGSSAGRP
jgi:adenosylhomocysteine nucleosidase